MMLKHCKGLIVTLVVFSVVQVQAQYAIIQGGPESNSQIRIFKGISDYTDDFGRVQQVNTVSYSLWDLSVTGYQLKKFLGCRGGKSYYESEIIPRRDQLYRIGNIIFAMDILALTAGVCLASGIDCFQYLGLHARSIQKVKGIGEIGTWITRLTGLTIVGGIASGLLTQVSNFFDPRKRWDEGNAIGVAWTFSNNSKEDKPEYDYRTDLMAFANSLSLGLCEIDRRQRQRGG